MSCKLTCLAVLATLLANCVQLTSSYIVHGYPITAGEVLLARSIIQIVVFGLSAGINKLKNNTSILIQQNKAKVACFVVAANLGLALSTLGCFLCLKLIPISDFIVLCFTSPIFTLAYGVCFFG